MAQLACPAQGSSWLGSQQPAPCTLAGAAGTRLRRPRAQGTKKKKTLPRLPSHLAVGAKHILACQHISTGQEIQRILNGHWCKCS